MMSNTGFTLWFTGLSGAGKSTLSEAIEQRLKARGHSVEVLDGDIVRTHLSKGLGFSREDRDINIKRIAFVCSMLTRNGVICVSAAISPYREAREWARKEIGNFVEVYVKCPLEVCRERDVKGLYKLVDEGKIKNFTGVDDPYEEPEHPELIIHTDKETVEESIQRIFAKLEQMGYLAMPHAVGAGASPALLAGDEAVGALAPALLADCPFGVPLMLKDMEKEKMNMMTDGLIAPHGGKLVLNMASEQEAAELRERARTMPRIVIGSRQLADLEMLAIGAYSPLMGFMNGMEYRCVVNEMHLSNGLPWTIPVTLPVTTEQAASLHVDSQVALVDAQNILQAVMTIEEKMVYDKRLEARNVYCTEDEAHPGVKIIYQQGDMLLGGPARVVALQEQAFARCHYTPQQSRAMFAERGWKRVVGFQTRNPVHRAHEYIQKCALETVDGLFLHPLVGDTKGDDIPAAVRMRCYEVLLENYYPADRVMLGVLPAAMRYAGPREAVFHAIMRKNYGCSHFIVGRDHAGVGNYYGTYDAHHIFAKFDPAKLAIMPMFFDHTFFCKVCDAMASQKTCPHGSDQHITLSGTKVRQMLQAGEMPPRAFSRPEVAAVLIEAMRQPVGSGS